MKVLISCLFFILTIGVSMPIPVSIFLQPMPTHHYCRQHSCYNPWTPINSHMMVPMMTGVYHSAPRTYILRLLQTNSSSSIPRISSTTEALPSCEIPSLPCFNTTETTIPSNTSKIQPPAQDPIVIKTDNPINDNEQKVIIQSMSRTESGIISSFTTANNFPKADPIALPPQEEIISSKPDNQAVKKNPIEPAAQTQNINISELSPESMSNKNIELGKENDLTQDKPSLIKPEEANDIASNQI